MRKVTAVFFNNIIVSAIALMTFSCAQNEGTISSDVTSKKGHFIFSDDVGYKFVPQNKCSCTVKNFRDLRDVDRDKVDISIVKKKDLQVTYTYEGDCYSNNRTIEVIKIMPSREMEYS